MAAEDGAFFGNQVTTGATIDGHEGLIQMGSAAWLCSTSRQPASAASSPAIGS